VTQEKRLRRLVVLSVLVPGLLLVLGVLVSILWTGGLDLSFLPGRAAPVTYRPGDPATGELVEVFHVPGLFDYAGCGDLYGDGRTLILAEGILAPSTLTDGPLWSRLPDDWSPGPGLVFEVEGTIVGSVTSEDLPVLAQTLLLAQLDTDPEKELVVGSMFAGVSVHDADGRELWKRESGFGGEAVAVADLDADGIDEVIMVGDMVSATFEVLRADGTLLWESSKLFPTPKSVVAGDLGLDGNIEVLAGGTPWDRDPTLSDLLTGPSAGGITVFSADGDVRLTLKTLGSTWLVALGDLVARKKGPEIVASGLASEGEEAWLSLFSGSGREIWRAFLGEGLKGTASHAEVAGGFLAVTTGKGDLLVFTGKGKLFAVEKGLGRMLSLAAHADADGRPLFVVANEKRLFGYTVGDEVCPPAAADR